MDRKPTFAFFGTPEIAVTALAAMEKKGVLPSLIICNPDAPFGRKRVLTPPPTKLWGEARGIAVFQPTTLKKTELLTPLTQTPFDFFVVFAYGKIIPETLLSLPRFKTINAHPSLLPKLRGASPIRSALLHDLSAIGITIIEMDKELDHGPILIQEPYPLGEPILGNELDHTLGARCGELLLDAMYGMTEGRISAAPQAHEHATFCGKIEKGMSELHLDPRNLPTGAEAYETYRKICAFDVWPGTFFMYNHKRIKIVRAQLKDHTLVIERVIPEGKKEIDFDTYVRSL